MKRSFLSLSAGVALALSAVTGAYAAVDTGAANSVISSLSSLPASADRDALIAQVQGLISACNSPLPRSCVTALQGVVSTAHTLGLSGGLAGQVAALARDAAANTPGVTSDPEYVALARDVDGLSGTAPTGAVGGGAPAGGGGGATGGGTPGGGGGDFGPDKSASPGVTG
jgi:hypothetical protein